MRIAASRREPPPLPRGSHRRRLMVCLRRHPGGQQGGAMSSLDQISRPIEAERTLADMVFLAGGEFAMGSDRHYPEEAPVHRVSVGAFWIDRTPVTNRQFRKFVNATKHVTFAEIAPRAEDYPGALPHMLKARSEERRVGK